MSSVERTHDLRHRLPRVGDTSFPATALGAGRSDCNCIRVSCVAGSWRLLIKIAVESAQLREGPMRLSIHVLESRSDLSMVTSDGRLPPIQTFAHKCHAVAFGRALAFSPSLPLWVYGDDGVAVRQSPESLTYPTRLS